jgi:hypothetical protein
MADLFRQLLPCGLFARAQFHRCTKKLTKQSALWCCSPSCLVAFRAALGHDSKSHGFRSDQFPYDSHSVVCHDFGFIYLGLDPCVLAFRTGNA